MSKPRKFKPVEVTFGEYKFPFKERTIKPTAKALVKGKKSYVSFAGEHKRKEEAEFEKIEEQKSIIEAELEAEDYGVSEDEEVWKSGEHSTSRSQSPIAKPKSRSRSKSASPPPLPKTKYREHGVDFDFRNQELLLQPGAQQRIHKKLGLPKTNPEFTKIDVAPMIIPGADVRFVPEGTYGGFIGPFGKFIPRKPGMDRSQLQELKKHGELYVPMEMGTGKIQPTFDVPLIPAKTIPAEMIDPINLLESPEIPNVQTFHIITNKGKKKEVEITGQLVGTVADISNKELYGFNPETGEYYRRSDEEREAYKANLEARLNKMYEFNMTKPLSAIKVIKLNHKILPTHNDLYKNPVDDSLRKFVKARIVKIIKNIGGVQPEKDDTHLQKYADVISRGIKIWSNNSNQTLEFVKTKEGGSWVVKWEFNGKNLSREFPYTLKAVDDSPTQRLVEYKKNHQEAYQKRFNDWVSLGPNRGSSSLEKYTLEDVEQMLKGIPIESIDSTSLINILSGSEDGLAKFVADNLKIDLSKNVSPKKEETNPYIKYITPLKSMNGFDLIQILSKNKKIDNLKLMSIVQKAGFKSTPSLRNAPSNIIMNILKKGYNPPKGGAFLEKALNNYTDEQKALFFKEISEKYTQLSPDSQLSLQAVNGVSVLKALSSHHKVKGSELKAILDSKKITIDDFKLVSGLEALKLFKDNYKGEKKLLDEAIKSYLENMMYIKGGEMFVEMSRLSNEDSDRIIESLIGIKKNDVEYIQGNELVSLLVSTYDATNEQGFMPMDGKLVWTKPGIGNKSGLEFVFGRDFRSVAGIYINVDQALNYMLALRTRKVKGESKVVLEKLAGKPLINKVKKYIKEYNSNYPGVKRRVVNIEKLSTQSNYSKFDKYLLENFKAENVHKEGKEDYLKDTLKKEATEFMNSPYYENNFINWMRKKVYLRLSKDKNIAEPKIREQVEILAKIDEKRNLDTAIHQLSQIHPNFIMRNGSEVYNMISENVRRDLPHKWVVNFKIGEKLEQYAINKVGPAPKPKSKAKPKYMMMSDLDVGKKYFGSEIEKSLKSLPSASLSKLTPEILRDSLINSYPESKEQITSSFNKSGGTEVYLLDSDYIKLGKQLKESEVEHVSLMPSHTQLLQATLATLSGEKLMKEILIPAIAESYPVNKENIYNKLLRNWMEEEFRKYQPTEADRIAFENDLVEVIQPEDLEILSEAKLKLEAVNKDISDLREKLEEELKQTLLTSSEKKALSKKMKALDKQLKNIGDQKAISLLFKFIMERAESVPIKKREKIVQSYTTKVRPLISRKEELTRKVIRFQSIVDKKTERITNINYLLMTYTKSIEIYEEAVEKVSKNLLPKGKTTTEVNLENDVNVLEELYHSKSSKNVRDYLEPIAFTLLFLSKSGIGGYSKQIKEQLYHDDINPKDLVNFDLSILFPEIQGIYSVLDKKDQEKIHSQLNKEAKDTMDGILRLYILGQNPTANISVYPHISISKFDWGIYVKSPNVYLEQTRKDKRYWDKESDGWKDIPIDENLTKQIVICMSGSGKFTCHTARQVIMDIASSTGDKVFNEYSGNYYPENFITKMRTGYRDEIEKMKQLYLEIFGPDFFKNKARKESYKSEYVKRKEKYKSERVRHRPKSKK